MLCYCGLILTKCATYNQRAAIRLLPPSPFCRRVPNHRGGCLAMYFVAKAITYGGHRPSDPWRPLLWHQGVSSAGRSLPFARAHAVSSTSDHGGAADVHRSLRLLRRTAVDFVVMSCCFGIKSPPPRCSGWFSSLRSNMVFAAAE